ncbi:MAG: hypothetical protein A2161_03990 [Candidatus Schekmanbacteria bacterium RBG_13_48_7]|uniref:DUF5683 domain-containing protein n=1 Tax=Candidatus Schekmanbacteria bacterium RBG_13_48_7 TaxID=1817878 RepID=A0A1F7RW76_9BACT|nr:MAG: hypothetical protein A2161_03990 [Candidatus Schekmanbacteria bacterium RBG_13_48_7]
MKNHIKFFVLLILFMMMVMPAWTVAQDDSTKKNDNRKIGTDDYIMFAAGGLLGAGIQEIYYREKPSAESRTPAIVMGYFIWNAVVIIKELQFDDGEDRIAWEDIAIANAGFTLGTLIWNYTVGKSIKINPKKPLPHHHHQYLMIGNKQTQIRLY